MEAQEAVKDARAILADKLELPGAVLFSGIDTLTPGLLYVMGFNPGGDPEDTSTKGSVGESLASSTQRYNDWADGKYGSGGASVLQLRVRSVFEAFGADPRRTFCTNALFTRSNDARGIDRPWDFWWDQCWPVHRLFLSIVRPRIIICFGNGAEESTWEMLRTPVRKEGHRYERAFQNVDGENSATARWQPDAKLDLCGDLSHVCGVLGLPHPSPRVIPGWVRTEAAPGWRLADQPLEKLATARAAAVAWEQEVSLRNSAVT